MNPALEPGDRPDRLRHLILPVSLSVVALTLLFTTQEVMRRAPGGQPINLWQSLGVNALDWASWGILVPVILVIGRQFRLDDASNRVASVAVWITIGIASCITQGIITGLVLRAWALPRFNLTPPGVPRLSLGRYLQMWVIGGAGFNMIIFLMIAGVVHATLYYRDFRARQLREVDLEARLARAELNVLRMQLQPHFFFNALHTISSLMMSDVPAAHRVIAALGDLLRASLDHTARHEIPLRDEVAFVGRYLDIQKARFRNRLRIEIDVDDALADALVPSLVLQPLVENAIRHGIEAHTDGGTIWIRAERSGEQLLLKVRDNGSAQSDDAAPRHPRTDSTPGIGLLNIENRLVQLYGTRHTFRAQRASDGQFEVSLALPFHTDAELFPASRNGQTR